MKKVTLLLAAILLIFSTLLLAKIFAQDAVRSSNVEFNPLAIDEDKCPGVLVFPGTKSGSYNAYYYLVKPYPKMNIDFEDVAYIPSFKKQGDMRSFYYAFYFPSYNETNPFDDFADVPCSKDQLQREIIKTLPVSERPNPGELNLSGLKINTISFSIPKYYRDHGFELVYDEALNDNQNAGVIYSRGTFVLELKVPESEFENLLDVLRSDVGFPLSIRMGFKAKEQRDYKEVSVDVGSMLNELKVKLGAKNQYFSEAKVAAAIKTTSSFANIQIYGETANIDQWITTVLIPLLSQYSMGPNQTQQNAQNPQGQTTEPGPYNPNPTVPHTSNTQGDDVSTSPVENNKIQLNLAYHFESDVKKFKFTSDVLNPNASQEYLVYQYPLRYYGEIDGNYFVLESNRYEETDRYSHIYLNQGESLEFSIEGYWEVSPKLVRTKSYYTKENLDSGEIPDIFTRNSPSFKVEKNTGDLFVFGSNSLLPGFTIKGEKMAPYAKIGRVKIDPISWGNGYFPKYFNWKPFFPVSNVQGNDKASKNLRGTNLFDVTVPVNNLRPYSIQELLKMIPLGVRLWKGKAVPLANMPMDVKNSYLSMSFNSISKTVTLTAKRSGYLYFENLDFVKPEFELKARSINDSDTSTLGDKDWRYITEDDFIRIDERLFQGIEKKDFDNMNKWAEKSGTGFLGLSSHTGEFPESWKPLEYDYIHVYPDSLAQAFSSNRIIKEVFYPLKNPKIEVRTYIKLKIFDKN